MHKNGDVTYISARVRCDHDACNLFISFCQERDTIVFGRDGAKLKRAKR